MFNNIYIGFPEMFNAFLRLTLVSLLTFIFTFTGFAQSQSNYSVEDALKVQTIVFQTELYREYKIVIEDAVSREEQRIAKEAKDWNTDQWHGFIDTLIDEKIILAIDENSVSKEKIPFLKKLKEKVSKGLKSVVGGIVSMGRTDGTGTVIAYLGGSAAGYAMMGVGMVIGSAGMVSFFSVFPVSAVTVSAVLAIKSIADGIKMKKAFNEGEDVDYYSQYKDISKKVKKHLNIKKGDLIYAFSDQNGVVIRKKGILPGILSFFGFNKDKLSMNYLVRALRREGLYSGEIKKIRKSKELGHVEKIVSMIQYIENNFDEEAKERILARFNRQRVYDLPIVENMQEIAMWAIEASKIQNLDELTSALNKAPSSTPFVTVVKVYQDFIFPKISKSLKGIDFKRFKCLREGFFKQTAVGHKNIRLQWLVDSKEVMEMNAAINACVTK